MFRRGWILLFILLCPHCFGADDGGCTERTVIVSASDDNGKAIPFTPQSEDIRGKINGKPVQVLGVTKPANAERVVIVLDASGSMSWKWQKAVELAVEIVRDSPSSTEFALVLFAGNELRTVGFGKTGPEMITEIMSFKDVKPDGHTGLRDAIWEAVSMFQPSQQGDTIVVVSDGRNHQSKVSMGQLREAMWSRGIRFMFAQFEDHNYSTTTDSIGYTIQIEDSDNADLVWLSEGSGGFLSRISQSSGGLLPRIARIQSPQVVPKAAQEIAFEIENYLVVRITFPTPLEKEASLHLEAVDPSGRKRKNLELRFPEKLPPCASLASRQ